MDGVDVRDYNLKALRQKIGSLFHKKALPLQNDSWEPFVMGKKMPSVQELEQAAEISQAKESIDSRENALKVLWLVGSNLQV